MTEKFIQLTLLVLLILSGHLAEAQTSIYIVRHAEKQATDADPELSPQGQERALELIRILKDVDIQHVYSTPYNRTLQTVLPLAKSKGLKVLEYNPMAQGELMSIIEKSGNTHLLIAGHSNTVPLLLNLLTGTNKYQQLHESDYDNLYIVDYSDSEVHVHSLEYGDNSPY